MGTDDAAREPRVVLWFAVATLVAFLVIGAALSFLTVRTVRAGAEAMATSHARFALGSVLAPILEGVDLSRPLRGAEYERVRALVERHLISPRDVRVKVWRPDGTIVFSDEPSLVGQRFPEEVPELRRVLAGAPISGLTELEAAEEREERPVADRLFAIYLPLRLEPGSPPVAVVELYQDAGVVQREVDPTLRALWAGLVGGLVVLYAALLPIAVRASRELRHRNEHLREQAGRLSELLAREQATVERLRELNKAKDDLLAAVSHELRTPLTSVLGYLRTLRRPGLGEDPATREEFLRAAQRQAERLSRSIRDLLAAAELERGGRPIERSGFDLASLVEGVLDELPGARDRVRLDLPRDLLVDGDRERLAHVVGNLLDNALKYSPDGGDVEVAARVVGGALEVRVRDEGVGIDPTLQARVYEPFFQADQSSTRRFGGLGLGLHVVRGIVEELGGRVVFASDPGVGTAVSVTIPLGGAEAGGRSREPSGPSEGGRGVAARAGTDAARLGQADRPASRRPDRGAV